MTSTKAPKPIKLISPSEISTREGGIAVAAGKMIGRVETTDSGRCYAYTGRSTGDYCMSRDDALACIAGATNARKIRSALTAAGYKAPSGVYAGTEVVATGNGSVRVSYVTRGFGSVMSGERRLYTMTEIRELLRSRCVAAELVDDGKDRWGTRWTVTIPAVAR